MKRLITRLSAALLLMLLCAAVLSCTEEATAVVYAMDTVSQIRIYAGSGSLAKELTASAEALVRRFDKAFSASAGDIALLNSGKKDSLTGEAAEVVLKALYIKELSGGAFSPEIGALTSLWNISALAGTTAEPPSEEEIARIAALDGRAESENGMLTLEGDIKLDLGGIAKGAVCAYIVESMKEGGASGGIIDLGGNIAVFGEKPNGKSLYKIALTCASEAFAYIETGEAFVSIASSELRFFEDADGNRYHHILDPATGRPADSEFLAVAVICRDGAYADALSTAIFVAGWNRALEMRENCTADFDIVALMRSGDVISTEDHKVISGIEISPVK